MDHDPVDHETLRRASRQVQRAERVLRFRRERLQQLLERLATPATSWRRSFAASRTRAAVNPDRRRRCF